MRRIFDPYHIASKLCPVSAVVMPSALDKLPGPAVSVVIHFLLPQREQHMVNSFQRLQAPYQHGMRHIFKLVTTLKR